MWWAAEQTWGARPLGSLQFLIHLWASGGRSVADTPMGEGGSGWHRLRSAMPLSQDSSQATAGAPDTVELTATSASPNPALLANPSIRTLSNLTRVKILTKLPITLNRYPTPACSLLTTALPAGLMPSLCTCRAAAGSPPRAPPEAPRESDYMAFSASQCPTYCCVF